MATVKHIGHFHHGQRLVVKGHAHGAFNIMVQHSERPLDHVHVCVSPRHHEHRIVVAACHEGRWHHEDAINGVEIRGPFVIEIHDKKDDYHIIVDGRDMLHYHKEASEREADHVLIDGEVRVDEVMVC